MLIDLVAYLNNQLSDFGTVMVGAVSFWLIYFLFVMHRSSVRRRAVMRRDLARSFGLPPPRSGGR